MSDFDPPEPPWENVCEHNVNRYQNCEKCNDEEAAHGDDLRKEKNDESS